MNRLGGLILIGLWLPAARGGPLMDQMHIATGMINSSIASSIGSSSGAISVSPSFDVGYERFRTDRSSLVFRVNIAYDLSTTVNRYFFGGLGRRFYFRGRGSKTVAMNDEVSLVLRPGMRYFLGWDAGLSQVVVNVLTQSLQSLTTAIDIGGVAGLIDQMGDNWGLEASLTMSYAYGFSSVSAAGTVTKIFFGVAYSF